jgi:hypothetical protein
MQVINKAATLTVLRAKPVMPVVALDILYLHIQALTNNSKLGVGSCCMLAHNPGVVVSTRL